MEAMEVSIIITCFNRPELLNFGLSSLVKQDFLYNDVEFIVLNDGDPNDNTENVCNNFKNLNIRYFAAQNKDEQWRVPGFAINFGVKQSKGKYIIISCAEMYHMDNSINQIVNVLNSTDKSLVIPIQGKDDNGQILNKLRSGENISNDDYNKTGLLHNIHLPFFMGMKKSYFTDIGGYDEDFVGIGYDDNDFVERMQRYGMKHIKTNCRVIHLYHSRISYGDQSLKNRIVTNKKLYLSRRNKIIRNENIVWGNNF